MQNVQRERAHQDVADVDGLGSLAFAAAARVLVCAFALGGRLVAALLVVFAHLGVLSSAMSGDEDEEKRCRT